MAISRADELASFRDVVVNELLASNEAREIGLTACRETIRSCSRSIRMVHRLEFAAAKDIADQAEASLRRAQTALEPFPRIKYAGFLHDAEKEYAEARLTAAFVGGAALETPEQIGVGVPGLVEWFNRSRIRTSSLPA